jgi:hypothetical protein
LLAESHVFTDEQDYEMELNGYVLNRILAKYPLRFVRFVYCLGYGENELLTRARDDKRNAGTPQYWKIFSSCIAKNENDLGSQRVLKTSTRSFMNRLHNKVNVLQQLREKGIWLLDASIVGIYRSGESDPKVKQRILNICWRNHIENIVQESNPKHIIVIGIGVNKILHSNLQKIGFPKTVIRQPQGDRRSGLEQLEKYKICQRICSKYC